MSQKDDLQEIKLVYGVVLSLRSLCAKLSPFDQSASRQPFRAYATKNYKLHYHETPTGLKIVLLTDVHAAGALDLMQVAGI